MRTLVTLAAFALAVSPAEAQSIDREAARRLDDARETIQQQRIARMPEAIRYIARNSKALEDQLLILGSAGSFEVAIRQEVSRMAVYMDPKAEHLRAVQPACGSVFPEARLVCVYVASRVPGSDANQILLRAELSGDPMTSAMAAQALSSRRLSREDAALLEHVFDSNPGRAWSLALTALCSSMDADRALRIRNRIEREAAVDARLLFERLFVEKQCSLDGEVHRPPER